MTAFDPRRAAEADRPDAPSPLEASRRRIAAARKAGRTPSVIDREKVAAADGAKAGNVGRMRAAAADIVAAAAALPNPPERVFRFKWDASEKTAAAAAEAGAETGVYNGQHYVVHDAREVLAAAEAGARAARDAAAERTEKAAAKATAKAAKLPAGAAKDAAEHRAAGLTRAAKTRRPGLIGRYSSPDADRWTLADIRRIIREESGPLIRLAAAHGYSLTSDEYASMSADCLAAFLASDAAKTAATLSPRCRRCGHPARWLALLDNGVPGTETAIPTCDRHAGHAPGRPILAAAEPPLALMAEADARRLAGRVAKAWMRRRAERLAATVNADAEAAEGTPAKAAATAMDTVAAEHPEDEIRGAVDFLPAAIRAAERMGMRLTAAERWCIRWGVHLRRINGGKAAGTLAPTVSSATLAAAYGASESAVRVGAMRGAVLLQELDAEDIREWGQGTGRILAATAGPADPLAPVLAAMRPAVTRNRTVALDWGMRLPKLGRDRDTGKPTYTDPPAPPAGAGWSDRHSLTASCAPPLPPRILAAAAPVPNPWSGFSALRVPISPEDTSDPRPCPHATCQRPHAGPSARWQTAEPLTGTVAPLDQWRPSIRGIGKPTPSMTAAQRATVAGRAAFMAAEHTVIQRAERQRLARRCGKEYHPNADELTAGIIVAAPAAH